MQKVLIVTENPEEQEYLRSRLNQADSLLVSTANPRQINSINLKKIRQSDVIILTEPLPMGRDRSGERLLGILKQTGLPIILLPMVHGQPVPREDSLILNLTDERLAQPGVASLINKVRDAIHPEPFAENSSGKPLRTTLPETMLTSTLPPLEDTIPISTPPHRGKFIAGLTALGRITKQLREPLSNMNLAIYMLEKVQSLEERDRYLHLLREEYQRELQLLHELETLHTSLVGLSSFL